MLFHVAQMPAAGASASRRGCLPGTSWVAEGTIAGRSSAPVEGNWPLDPYAVRACEVLKPAFEVPVNDMLCAEDTDAAQPMAQRARVERKGSRLQAHQRVRAEEWRRMLASLDVFTRQLPQATAPHADVLRLTGIHHPLFCAWSET